ncbi:MAG: alpha/beta fold hydrolase [Janthinobacterium lividum]
MSRADYREIGGALAFVEDHGEGPPVLCLHTAGQSGVQWRHAGRALAARGWRVLIPDLPGHGRSDPAPGGPVRDLGAYGAWCAQLIAELGLHRAAVIGCSIGGKIALDVACRIGGQLRGVVAMAADAGLDPSEGRAFARSMERELEDCAAASRSDRTYLGTLAVIGHAVPEPRRRLIATMHRREDPVVTNSDLIGWACFDRWKQLPQIRCPVHLVVGEDDLWMSLPRVERTAAQIPNARHTLLKGIGHYPMEELDTISDLLDTWLREFPEGAG